MEIVPFGPDDTDLVETSVALHQRICAADSPWEHPTTVREQASRFRYGWDDTPEQPALGFLDGEAVGLATYSASEHDNLTMAFLGVRVDPAHRRRGLGSELLEHLVRRAHDAGRSLLMTSGWESQACAGFAQRHGFEPRSTVINRRQDLDHVDRQALDRLRADAERAAEGYVLTRQVGPSPEADLEAIAALTAVINDAPTDDLDVEDEVFDADRIRAYEHAMTDRGLVLYRMFAHHGATGELAADTIVCVEQDRPEIAHQHDTIVAREHRGHRLGLWLKTSMVQWLREIQPQLRTIDTFNAESNDHMIAVNDLLGYRVLGRSVTYQRG